MLSDGSLNTRMNTVIVKRVTLPPLEDAGEVWEDNEKAPHRMDVVQTRAAQGAWGDRRARTVR